MSSRMARSSNGLPLVLTGFMTSKVTGKADLLAQDAPAFTSAYAADIAQRIYGISGDIRALPAEKDANFMIKIASGERVLLKITNAMEDQEVTDMQTAALMHLAATDPSLPVQRIYVSLDGNASETVVAPDGQTHVVRLLTFLGGTILSDAVSTRGLHFDLGCFLARVTIGLRGFFHPAAGHVLQWDIKQAAGLRPMLDAVQDVALRNRLTAALDRFDIEIVPRLPKLRAQVVHNDFNPHNVLVDGSMATRPVGLIDFGDVVHTPIIFDLAVACSYQIGEGAAPLDQMCRMIAGYASLMPLEREEVDLLPDLIRLRHATTLTVGASRAQRYPENADYILRNTAKSLRGMEALDRIGDAAVLNSLHAAAGTE